MEREVDEELRHHLEMERAELARRGLDPEEARRQALAALGGLERTKEEAREARGLPWLEDLAQDLRYGARTIARTPGFAVVSVTTLALAVCVNTAIFSVVNALVFADLPMEDPARTAVLLAANQGLDTDRGAFTLREYLEYREKNRSFEELAAVTGDQMTLTGEDRPHRVQGRRVTWNFLRVWGEAPVVGRGFLWEDHQSGAPPVVVLSHGFRTRRFAASEGVIGATLSLDGIEHTVVGVMSPEMEWGGLADVEVWTPLALGRADTSIDERTVTLLGRLRPGVTVEQADLDIRGIQARASADWPAAYRGWEPRAALVRDMLLDPDDRTILVLLALTVSLVLFIACANVANMLSARATTRAGEVAVRAALGASRLRLVRQMLTESFLIAAAAAVSGLCLSRGLLRVLYRISEGETGVYALAALDGNVLLFTVVVAVVTPLTFGLLPALRASAMEPYRALNDRGDRVSGRSGRKVRGLLVVTQMSVALTLMVVAGLVVRSVVNQQRRELGFDPSGVLTMRIDLPDSKYPLAVRQEQFFRETRRSVERLPGVQSVALADRLPVVEGGSVRPFEVEGRPAESEAGQPSAEVWIVSEAYLHLMRIPVVTGRGLSTDDARRSEDVALVSRAAARRYWNDGQPVGDRIAVGTSGSRRWLRVVGVVGDVASGDGGLAPRPAVYLPFGQHPRPGMTLLVRTQGDPLLVADPVRRAVWGIDSDQPIDDVRAFTQALRHDWAPLRSVVTLFVAFALFALAMAAVGIYGVVSYSVAQRTREVCIRMALGAGTGSVRRMMLGEGIRLIGLSTAVGLVGAWALSRLLASLVVGISSVDPLTFLGVPVLLAAVGMAANYVPIRRVLRANLMTALKLE